MKTDRKIKFYSREGRMIIFCLTGAFGGLFAVNFLGISLCSSHNCSEAKNLRKALVASLFIIIAIILARFLVSYQPL